MYKEDYNVLGRLSMLIFEPNYYKNNSSNKNAWGRRSTAFVLQYIYYQYI